MDRKWRIGIIYDTSVKALGSHLTHLAFRGLPNAEVVALADSNMEKIEDRMANMEAKRHYVDYHVMLEKERPDIAILGSRHPDDHFEQIKACAEHGVHILCEKPMSADLQEADQIVAMTEKHHIKLAVAHLARYAPVFRTMKKMIESGVIGEPLTFYGRGKEDERGGGEDLIVLGTHILDVGCFLFGHPKSVFAEVTVDGRALRRDDRSTTKEPVGLVAGNNLIAHFSFPNQVRGLFESRKGLYKGKNGKVRMGVTVAGTEGMLSMRYDEDRFLRLTRSPFPPEDETTYEIVPLEVPEIAGAAPLQTKANTSQRYFEQNNRYVACDLMQAIEEDRSPISSDKDGQFVLEMLYGIYASQLEGRRISLPMEDRVHPLAKPEIS